jgi:CRISPR-associated endonuclease/helicase Cas3
MHPLIAHALDVAAVARVLAAARPIGVAPATLGFLVALHDIGKFSRPFQAKAASQWPSVLGPWPGAVPGARHDELGFALLTGELAGMLDPVLPPPPDGRWRAGHRMALIRALAGHHGRPPGSEARVGPEVFCPGCRSAAAAFIAVLYDVFSPVGLARPADERDVTVLVWRFAGLTTLADWIGSRQAWFPYASPTQVADPARYLREFAMPRAEMAVTAAGLRECPPAPFTGLRGLFSNLSAPSPLQAWAETAPLPQGAVLAVIEDLTGSGKTEAAMTLAHRLIADGRADGVFAALPTMATANAMFGRLADSYRRLFAPAANPSLALAHGRARLDPRFRDTIAADPDAPAAGHSADDPADDPAEAQCAAWLAEDRRRALLAQVGVGTIDQALLAILPVRHAALRQQGLAGKVLVIDEAHAFDAYMQHEILALLRFHAALGGSAIILSATLPQALRQKAGRCVSRGAASAGACGA